MNQTGITLTAFPPPLAVAGLNEAFKDIADVRNRRNPQLEVLGVVLTCVDSRTSLAREVEDLIAQELPGRAFETMITQATALPKCSGKGKTLFQVDGLGQHKVTLQYLSLAREIEARVRNRAAFLDGGVNALTQPKRINE